jgi:hypothetical protein
MPLSGSATSPNSMQLSDMEPPTDDDVFRILEWESDRRTCVTKELQLAGQIDPALVSVTVNFERSVSKLLSDVIDKKTRHEAIYYKDINMKISEIQENTKSSLRSWATQLRVRLAAQHQREANEQKAAQQRFFTQVGEVTVALAEAAVMSVVALKTAQAEMNNSRQRYLSQHPSYERNFQQNVSRCQWFGAIWQCNSTPF